MPKLTGDWHSAAFWILNNVRSGNMEIRRSELRSYATALIPNYLVPEHVAHYSESVRLNELAALLWRRKAQIAGAAIVGLLVGLAASHLTTPIFRARASLQIEGFSNDQFIQEVSPIAPLPNSTPENYLQNEVKLLESETLAKRIAERLADAAEGQVHGAARALAYIRNVIGFLRPAQMSAEQRRVKNIQKALSVRTSLQSQVIELFYDAPDPQLAARGANTAVTEFISLNREAGWKSAQDTTDWLNQQIADLKATIETSNGQLQDYARSGGLVFAGNQATLAEDRMRQLEEALAKSETDRAAKQSRYESALANSGNVVSDTVGTNPLQQYETDLQNLRKELAQLQTLYTPKNYRVQKVEAQITETEKSIENERKAIIGRLHMEYETAVGLEHLLSEVNARQLRKVQEQMDQERQYEVKKSEVDATQRLYESMLQKAKEAGAASALRTTNVRVIDPASVPHNPYSPNSALNMAIGFAIGTLGGIVFVLVAEGSDKVRRPGESSMPDLPELGVIPSARKSTLLEAPGRKQIASERPGKLLLADSFRATMTSIVFSVTSSRRPGTPQVSGRVLVVTSIGVMEGKTTVLTNLGVAAAERSQRVLLIDADLRRPRLHEFVNLPNQWGLADILRGGNIRGTIGQTPSENLPLRTHVPNLWVLPSGPTDADTLPSLYSSGLCVLLQRLRGEFDVILIDTPPVMLYAEARVLGRMSDGVILVVRANTKSRQELKAVHLKLTQDRIPVLGTVLNDWKMDPSSARAYGRYYDHYRPGPNSVRSGMDSSCMRRDADENKTT